MKTALLALLLALAACGGDPGTPPPASCMTEVPISAVTYSASGVAIAPAAGQHSGIFVPTKNCPP